MLVGLATLLILNEEHDDTREGGVVNGVITPCNVDEFTVLKGGWGGWVTTVFMRTSAFADGHCELHTAPNGDFES